MALGHRYIVRTDLPPGALTSLGVDIFLMWLDFAMGGLALGGKQIHYPSGRYAASISFRQVDETTMAIIADEGIAPEAAIIEAGHRSFDMKSVTQLSGRAVPMHRPVGAPAGVPLLRRGGGIGPSIRPSVWAEVRAGEGSGFASFGPNSPPGSWIIPAMPAMAPGYFLAALARQMSRSTQA